VFDAERLRFAVEYVTRVANDFNSTNMFFVKNCSLLFLENQPYLFVQDMASLHSASVMSFETEELVHFRGRDPVSAYPLIRLTRDFGCSIKFRCVSLLGREIFPEPFKFLEFLLESLAKLVMLIRAFDHRLV